MTHKSPHIYLSTDKIRHFTQIFINFDYYNTGTIHYTSVRQILKSMALELSDQDVLSLLADTGNANPTMVKLDQFLAVGSRMVQDKEMSQEIQVIFKIFDTDKNKSINKEDIKKAMTHIGIAYNQEQINDMLKISKKNSLTLEVFQQYILKHM